MKRTVAIFRNGKNRAIRLPKEMDFEGVNELEISREGDVLVLRPVRASWSSMVQEERADADFLTERQEVIEEGRFKL